MSRDEARCAQAREILKSLYTTNKAGTLTEAQIAQAVEFVYDDGDNYNASPGNNWIWENYESLSRVVPDVEAFFRKYLKYLANISVGRHELLALVPAEHRVQFLDDALRACIPWSYSWVRAAHTCDVARKDVAALLRRQIEEAPKHYGLNFVTYGAGDVAWEPLADKRTLTTNAPWSMFDDGELQQILRLCIKEPDAAQKLLEKQKELNLRFGKDVTSQLCNEAAGNATSVTQIAVHILRQLSLNTRLVIARRIKLETYQSAENTAMFICDVVMDIVDREQKPNPADYNELLDKISWTPTLYRAAHSLHRDVPAWFEQVLLDRLTHDGFIIGTVELGQHKSKKTKRPVSQWQVIHGDRLYVQDQRQHDYFPSKGSRVIVQPKTARFLTSRDDKKVYAAYFIPTTEMRG